MKLAYMITHDLGFLVNEIDLFWRIYWGNCGTKEYNFDIFGHHTEAILNKIQKSWHVFDVFLGKNKYKNKSQIL